MPRRELLTPAQREQLLAFPTDEAELIRLYSLSETDQAFLKAHRGIHNRLGVAVQMAYLRFPGRPIARDETPYPTLLAMVAAQIKAPVSAWSLYAERDQTRRMHAIDLIRWLGLRQLDAGTHRSLAQWLLPIAMQSTQGPVLVQALIEEMRRRGIVLPPIGTLERLCAEVHTRAQRRIFKLLTQPLNDTHCAELDALLDIHKGGPITTLTWLRQPPGKPNAKMIMSHISRLKILRALALPENIGRDVNADRLLRMAREGAQMSVYQLKEYEPLRRHATLVAITLDVSATLTDQILDLHDRLIGTFFTRSKHKHKDRFAADGKALNAKVRLYADVGAALIAARKNKDDAYAAIEKVLSWAEFERSVQEAKGLARDEAFDSTALMSEFFGQLRRYTPAFLDLFEFRAAPVRQRLLDAIDVLRKMNRTSAQTVPADAPVDFFKPSWQRFVMTGDGIDRRFYEIAAVSELKDALRSGDVFVAGSRQFKDFDEYLLPQSLFNQQQTEGRLDLSVPTEVSAYLDERLTLLREALSETNRLAAADELPFVKLDDKGLKVSPIEDETPPQAKVLKAQAYAMLPRIKITDLLLEVISWIDFTQQFTHLKTGDSAKDRTLLLTAILADAFNLGLEKMAEACPGVTATKLSYLVAWHVRTETYSKALAELVNFHHRLPFSKHWGDGSTSSSDGQRFKAGGHAEGSGYRNAKYGDDPGVLFYTHVSSQYGGFHIKVINGPVRDATHVLDGLLYHESDLRIEEHYTDTAGFTDHIFGLCPVVGFTFAPRIADLKDKRIFVPGKAEDWPALSTLIGGNLNVKSIEQVFDDVRRLGASIKQGTVTSSLMLRKLSAYPRQNSIAIGLREMGRIERSLHTLKWLREPEYRRRVGAGLNKGESRHKLARAVFFHRLGEIRDRAFEDQQNRASGLNLVMQAITIWNTVYLDRAIQALRQHQTIDDSMVSHISPLGWHHVNLTGDYSWAQDKQPSPGEFRALRPAPKKGAPKEASPGDG
ncbi:Tn3 family transposase [Pelomonas aquatica]|uniref:Tn3 family transposase n=1 Tax=Pelomonas aquatica TaxID=431058 RepID=A0A9X4R5Y2_9BURK|nr:Tn3 family transposase [Pelomonas aquatica]MCY4757279.1 Tn3 family transposase [Pelomonas aquatica]MDG0864150.1 Tn3 family transposase [Pelomonas aquatica]